MEGIIFAGCSPAGEKASAKALNAKGAKGRDKVREGIVAGRQQQIPYGNDNQKSKNGHSIASEKLNLFWLSKELMCLVLECLPLSSAQSS